ESCPVWSVVTKCVVYTTDVVDANERLGALDDRGSGTFEISRDAHQFGWDWISKLHPFCSILEVVLRGLVLCGEFAVRASCKCVSVCPRSAAFFYLSVASGQTTLAPQRPRCFARRVTG
ncbi:unnamed protein product, partial [Hapterophycus canaliculatus]